MARGKRTKYKSSKKLREECDKFEIIKPEVIKKFEDKCSNRANIFFKSEEIQEICAHLNVEELGDQHCFFGAVAIGKFEIVKRLLKEGYPLDCFNENKETALMVAIRLFQLPMVDFLVSRGADISLTDSMGNTALLLAAQNSFWDQDSFSGLWHSVHDHAKLQADHANKAGYCLLHYITKRQWKAVLDMILLLPLNLNCSTNKGVTPLIMAASRGDYVFVKSLLEAGADFTTEDQQKCTALCYTIAFSLQKNVTEPNKVVEIILAAINEEHSKLSLENYLKRRLELLVNPPKSRTEFCKTVKGVFIHVLTFFARFIYSGMELLIELSVFPRLKEALEKHLDDSDYTIALLGVTLELVRHSDCSQGLTQPELADEFFSAGLGKCCLEILHRNGLGKTAVIKAVFLLLIHLCTSESYKARTWIETNQEFLQSYFIKYMRSFSFMFLDTSGDQYLETMKQRSESFQMIMKTLKAKGWIVTKKEHKKNAQQLKDNISMVQFVGSQNNAFNFYKKSSKKKLNPISLNKKSKPSTVYNSIIQYNFGKLENNHAVKDLILKQKQIKSKTKKCVEDSKTKNLIKENIFRSAIKEIQQVQVSIQSNNEPLEKLKERKCRLAIKEIQQAQNNVPSNNETLKKINSIEFEKQISSSIEKLPVSTSISNSNSHRKISSKQEIREKFTEGYQLFQMEDDLFSDSSSEEEYDSSSNHSFEWMDMFEENKIVSDGEVASTMNHLQEIFDRIIRRYDSTWKRQYEEGYIGFQGNPEDLLKLMQVLPELENYHIQKLMLKWKNFCNKIKDHARKNHVIYGAMVSEMQVFLLEFESELDKKNIKVFSDSENSYDDVFIHSEVAAQHLNNYYDSDSISSEVSKNEVSERRTNVHNVDIALTNSKLLHLDVIDSNNRTIIVQDTSENDFDNDDTFKDDFMTINKNKYLTNSIWDVRVLEYNKAMSLHDNINHEIISDDHDKLAENNSFSRSTETLIENEIFEKIITNFESVSTIKSSTSGDSIASIESQGILHDLHEELSFVTPETINQEQSSENLVSLTSINSEIPKVLKRPPGFENIHPLTMHFNDLSRMLAFCGTKYQDLCLALMNLPACKTELLAGGSIRAASFEFQTDFKLFNGCNFGDVELGISSDGMPLAVRRFQKFDTLCNKAISSALAPAVQGLLGLHHDHLLPYLSCHCQSSALIIVMPLCVQDLGQHIRQLRTRLFETPDYLTKLTPYLLTMANHVMSGLHYLHTQKPLVVHGNLKPSNILVDASGSLHLAEFGLHEMLFQQKGPALTSMIWWSRETLLQYQESWKFKATKQSDIQSAGMLTHFILSLGYHPYGQDLKEIIQNIMNGTVMLQSTDPIANDAIHWMLAHQPQERPTTFQILRHVMFWNNNKRWNFLRSCSGLENSNTCPILLDKLFFDLDILGQIKNINTKWISVLKQQYGEIVVSNMFEDKPSGLLKFLNLNLDTWTEDRDSFLQMFPVLPLNLYRLLEQTVWIDHPVFEPFMRINILS